MPKNNPSPNNNSHTPQQLNPNGKLLKRLWNGYMRLYWKHYIAAIFCLALLASSNAIIINQVPKIIDDVLKEGNLSAAYWVAIVIFFTLVMRGIAAFGQAVLLNSVMLQIIRTLQNEMFEVLTSVDMVYLQKSGTASQISRFTNDVNTLSSTTGRMVTGFGKEFILLVAMLGTMLYYNVAMAAVVLMVFPLLIIPVIYLARKIRKLGHNIQLRLSDTTAILDDSLKSAIQVRAYNLQDMERSRVNTLFHKVYNLSLRSAVFKNLVYPILDICGGLIFAAVLLWGAHAVMQNTMSSGEFITFFVAMFASYTPLRSLSGLYAILQSGLAAADRIFNLLDYTPEITTAKNAPILKVKKGDIQLKNVTFAYNEDTPNILKNLSVKFVGGKRNALVGYSGSGKTTLLQLIPRFFDANQGEITIDGQDICTTDITSLRNNIGMVFQNAPLFNSSIGDNICLGKKVSQKRLQQVCRQALLDDFIAALPDGLDTQVGELGNSISGGQRQRIAIARALLKDAPILLLDEATSALDQANERKLNDALESLMQGRTVIVIAHRLSTVKGADKIYLLQSGQIVGQGSHSELLKKSDYYRNLCDGDLKPSPPSS